MSFHVIRAKEEYERAGAYYVRIQAMAKQYGITLREEFDDIDGAGCHYIVILDDFFPVATCRWFEVEPGVTEIGRIVVLPDYRGKHLGELLVTEAEKWIAEAGYQKITLSSREEVVGFYEKLGYSYNENFSAHSHTFQCIYMEKILS